MTAGIPCFLGQQMSVTFYITLFPWQQMSVTFYFTLFPLQQMSVTFYFNHDVHTFLSACFRSSVAIFFCFKKRS
jgi:hypothetical protein